MKKCLNCGVELSGLKKMFCSKKCKEALRWSRMTEEDRIIQRAKNRERYKELKEERLAQKREYYSLNKDEIKKKNALYKKLHPEIDRSYSKSIKGKYRDYKKGAKSRNYKFDLSLKQFSSFEKTKCFYCGDEFESVGIDRKNNSEGYTMENSVSCCPMCNRMKHAFGYDEFLEKCKKITLNNNCS